jgi:hypothetical protein
LKWKPFSPGVSHDAVQPIAILHWTIWPDR